MAMKKGIKIKSAVRAGGLMSINHNAAPVKKGIKIKSAVRAGGLMSINHNAVCLAVH